MEMPTGVFGKMPVAMQRCNIGADQLPSYAGLTRVSINLRKSLSKKMDCRVKPGNDEF
jgi:hypothetical protein